MDRSQKPSPNGDIIFHLPKINVFQLSNGIKVFHVEKDKLPIVNISMMVSAGSKFDLFSKKGLAYLTSMLIDEGAGNLAALEIDAAFDSMGSIFGISTDKDSIYLSLLSLKENFQKSFSIFSSILREPHFHEDDFAREHQKLIAKIIQAKDSPSAIASNVFDRIIFRGTNYASPVNGRETDVTALANDDVLNFYKNNFAPKNCTIVAVGNISEEALHEILNSEFADWQNTTDQFEIITNTQPFNKKIFLVDKEGAAQSEIRVGHLSNGRNAADFFPRYIANMILGGQFSSRLNLNLRENKGYTYGIHSSFSFMQDNSAWVIDTAVEGKNTAQAVFEILKEIDGVRAKIKTEELEFAKSSSIKKFPLMFETYSQVARNLSLIPTYSLPIDYFDNFIKNIEFVNLEQVQQAAINNFRSNELGIFIVGDKNSILPQLSIFENLEITALDLLGNELKL